jgi:cell division protein FtsI (penicillin-binding protein 3)
MGKVSYDHSVLVPTKARFLLVLGVLILLLGGLFVRFIFLMTDNEKPIEQVVIPSVKERGPIMDRNGKLLAVQAKFAHVSIWKPSSTDPTKTAELLAPLLDMSAGEIKNIINQSKNNFVYLKKRIDEVTARSIEEVKQKYKLQEVKVEYTSGRIYPEKRLASALIGFVGENNHGLGGIEYALDSFLYPQEGSSYGNQVVLTIDIQVQRILEEIAQKSLDTNKADGVIMVAMDSRTGEILGYVSLPSFDPNDISTSREEERQDRIAQFAYEPGSVFKVFSIASMLDLGAITDSSTFYCNGQYEKTTRSGETITIKCMGSHGTVHAREIITYSCNAGAAYASDQVDSVAFYTKLLDLGFGAKTPLGLPGETAGFLRPVQRWSARSKQTIAMGQEIAVSALQVLQAATAVAQDGLLLTPSVVSRILNADGSILKQNVPQGKQVFQPETARLLRSYMASAASTGGTGYRARVEDIPIGVKTGTAQLIDPKTGAYSKTDYIASCLAILPIDRPQLILYHVVIKPKGPSIHGGRISTIPIREAADALADYLAIPRGNSPQVQHSGTVQLQVPPLPQITDTVPDLRGLGKKQLLPLLLRDDITIDIKGDGWVQRQDPPPGTPLQPGMVIHVELE